MPTLHYDDQIIATVIFSKPGTGQVDILPGKQVDSHEQKFYVTQGMLFKMNGFMSNALNEAGRKLTYRITWKYPHNYHTTMSQPAKPLTIADLPKGTKVKVPTAKSRGVATLEEFNRELTDSGYQLPYLVVTETSAVDEGVILDYEGANPSLSLYACAFQLCDIQLYTEPLYEVHISPQEKVTGTKAELQAKGYMPEPSNQSMKEYSEEQFAPIQRVIDGLQDLLKHKNRKYGNSYASESGVFSKSSVLDKLLARADDKISRIKNNPELQRNDVCDLAGYLLLIMAHQGWNDFTDQKD